MRLLVHQRPVPGPLFDGFESAKCSGVRPICRARTVANTSAQFGREEDAARQATHHRADLAARVANDEDHPDIRHRIEESRANPPT